MSTPKAETHPADSVIATLAEARRVRITTHVRPDGDALGSTAALVFGLRQRGIEASVLLLSDLPEKYAWMYAGDPGGGVQGVPFGVVPAPSASDLEGYDVLAVVDTGTWSQLPGLADATAGWKAADPARKRVVIDHHLTQEAWAEARYVDTSAAAAAEVVASLLRRWDERAPTGEEVHATAATCLYAALVSDTGWFQFANTSADTFRLAAWLRVRGADHEGVYRRLYQSERPERLALQARGLASLSLRCDGRLAVMTLTPGDFAETAGGQTDTENLVNLPLSIATVEASVLLTHDGRPSPDGRAGPVRVSLRSKGGVDVAGLANHFGGGGHARAAGMKWDGDPASAVAALESAFAEAFGR